MLYVQKPLEREIKMDFGPLHSIRDSAIKELDDLLISTKFNLFGIEDCRDRIYIYHDKAVKFATEEILKIKKILNVSNYVTYNLKNFTEIISGLKHCQKEIIRIREVNISNDLYNEEKIIYDANLSNYTVMILDHFKSEGYGVEFKLVELYDNWSDNLPDDLQVIKCEVKLIKGCEWDIKYIRKLHSLDH